MQIPILNGIYTDSAPDFRTSYPRNLVPVPKSQGISEGYLRPADGIVGFDDDGPGIDRGAINWNGVCYRVMGTKLTSIDANGGVTTLGDVGGTGQVSMDYSFDCLAIASGGDLFYWDGATLVQNTDPDLGTVLDVLWIDGYFMTTDGENLVVTELNDRLSVNPLKYGSSEVDPDPVKCLLELRNEAHALNRYSIESFENIGGDFFPLQRIDGAHIPRGTIGTHSACIFADAIAFLGGGKKESPAIWLGANGTSRKISTQEIDKNLKEFSETALQGVVLEAITDESHGFLYVHLPDRCLVYDAGASAAVGEPVWCVLTTSLVGNSQYRARNFVWCYDKWLVGDPQSSAHGYIVDNISSHWGQINGWEFGTLILYNESRSGIVHELELVALTGHVAFDDEPVIWTSYSKNGQTWSQEKAKSAGNFGQTDKVIAWLGQGTIGRMRIQKFRGTSDAHVSIARLEARIESLSV